MSSSTNFIKTPSFKLAVYAKGDPAAKKLALVLPGRLDTKDYISTTTLVDTLAKRGFYALSFDPPGSWESSGDYTDYKTTTYLKAIDELLNQLGDRPTFLVGFSRGGSVAMLTSQAHKNILGLALLMANYEDAQAPMSGDIQDGIYITTRDLPPGDGKAETKVEMKLSLEYFEDSKSYSPKDALMKFTGPKLIVCGTHDEACSPAIARKAYEELAEPKEFLELPTEHDYRRHTDMVNKVNEAVIGFARKLGN